MVKFDISDYLSVGRLLYWRRLLWRSQYDPPEKLANLQWKLLSRLLDHCFRNVPYYKNEWKKLGLVRADFRSLADLSKLPVIGKGHIFDHGELFKADGFSRYRPKPVQTSGTTGSPMKVYWDVRSNVLELLCQWRHYSWFGYRIGTPFLDLRNYRQHLAGPWAWNWKCRGLESSIFFWNESNADECAAMLKKRRIRLWRGNPLAIYQLCLIFEKAGIRGPRPGCVITVGEALRGNERRVIENWTGCAVGDGYGLNEHTVMMGQCPEGSYHVSSEYGIMEILGEDGTPARPGEEGRIISTGLHNFAFPLLRYDTGDHAVPAEGPCACKRTLPAVRELTGRIGDKVLAVNGRWVSCLHRPFKYASGVRFSQIVQKVAGSIDVYIVPSEGFGPAVQAGITDGLRAELGQDMEIRVHLVDALPFQSSRKFKFVVNQLPDAGKI
jgi:phenylacetate-CoA ligase